MHYRFVITHHAGSMLVLQRLRTFYDGQVKIRGFRSPKISEYISGYISEKLRGAPRVRTHGLCVRGGRSNHYTPRLGGKNTINSFEKLHKSKLLK